MKDRHLRVRPSACKRSFYLFRPAKSMIYHVRFTPPRWSFARAKLGGKGRIVRSTGTSEPKPAIDIAEQIINSFWQADQSGAAAREGLTVQSEFATIGELLTRYQACAKERPRTVQCNANALRGLVRRVHGGDVDGRSTSILTAELVRQFEALQTNAISTVSYLRQARSVVAPAKMRFYSGMNLPELTAFRTERVATPESADLEPLDMNALRAMDAASSTLAEKDPAVYVAHLLFSRLGLRNIEILNAREWWIVAGRLGIIKRPSENFKPKGRSAWLPVAPDVLSEIMRFRNLCTNGYLVPGANVTERHKAIYRRHSKWVSTWIKGRTKTSYELRRYAGSRLLDMGATMIQVRDFLRHKNIATTERWYAYRLENRNLPTIGMRDLLPADERVA